MSSRFETSTFILDNERDNRKLKVFYRSLKAYKYKRKIKSKYNADYVNTKYNTAICAIFKNEAKYLKEWIEYHLIVGIDHFYMYNNNSTDDFLSVLTPYIESGVVTLINWTKDQAQMECYRTCINDYSKETKWLGFIDIDEFVTPIKYNSVYEFLSKFENRGSVIIFWKIFGTSGFIKRDENNLVTNDFTVCWPKYMNVGKCFYNTKYAFNGDSENNKFLHHRLWATKNNKELPPVDPNDNVVLNNYEKETAGFGIQINHYFTKSFNEYLEKKSKGDVYFKINPHDEEYFYEHEMKCTSTDYSAYKYLIKLKLRMENKDGRK